MTTLGHSSSINGIVDTGNSSIIPLGVDATFTGAAICVLDWANVTVHAYSDVASATDGLDIQWSTDGVNWDEHDNFDVPVDNAKIFSFGPPTSYMRVVYTNGSTEQTTFRLQTILKNVIQKPSSHRISDSIVDQDDAELVKAVLTAEKDDGTFINIKATDSGNLKSTDAEDGLAIAEGEVSGKTFIHKFGKAPDFDIVDGYVTIWDGSDDGDIAQMQYVYSTSDDIDSISSSNNGDTQDIEVQGLDINYALVTQTITLTGQTRAALTTNLLRVFRMINVGSTDLAGHVYCYENTALTTGTPDDTTKVRAVINNSNNQSLMAIYTIPAGKTGYMRSIFMGAAGARKTSVHNIHLHIRPFGQVFQLKFDTSIIASGTSHISHKYTEPEIILEKSDIKVDVNTDEDIAGVSAGFDIVLVNN